MWKLVPESGLYEPQQIRTGNTFGPFRVQLADDAYAPFPLVGATLGGEVWPRATPGSPIALTVQFSDGTATAVDFFLAAATSAAFTSGSFFAPKNAYAYRVWYQTAGGIKKPLVQGPIEVFAGAATA